MLCEWMAGWATLAPKTFSERGTMADIRPQQQYSHQRKTPKEPRAEYTEKNNHVGWLYLPGKVHEVCREEEKFGFNRAVG